MEVSAEKAVGGSLYLLTFEAYQLLLNSPVLLTKYIINKQIKHYHIDNRDSFNASLKSIEILVPVGSLPGVIADMSLLFSVELKAANIFGPVMQDGTLQSTILQVTEPVQNPILQMTDLWRLKLGKIKQGLVD